MLSLDLHREHIYIYKCPYMIYNKDKLSIRQRQTEMHTDKHMAKKRGGTREGKNSNFM